MLFMMLAAVVTPWANSTRRQIRTCAYLADKRVYFALSEPLSWLRFLPKSWLKAGGGHWCCYVQTVQWSDIGRRAASADGRLQAFKEDLAKIGDLPRLHELEFTSLNGLSIDTNFKEAFASLAGIGDLHSLRFATTGRMDVILAGIPRIRTLKELTLNTDNSLTDQGLDELSKFPSLEFLNFDSVNISGPGLETIASLRHLREVSTTNSRFAASDLKRFLAHPTLERFDSASMMNDEMLKIFSSCPHLRYLNANGSLITDEGLSYLANLKGLEEIKLEITSIGDAGFAHLANCKSLKKVDCSFCKLTDAIGPTLQQLPNLESLRVQYTLITGKLIPYLADLKHLKEFETDGCRSNVDDALAPLPTSLGDPAGMTALLEAHYRFRTSPMPANRRNTWLRLARISGLGGRLHQAQDLSGVATIDLQNSDINDQDLGDLVQTCQPFEVNIQNTPTTSDGLASLAKASTINRLTVGPYENSDEALAIICSMPSLRRLDFSGSRGLTRSGLDEVLKIKNLESLIIPDCAYQEDFALKICKLPKLEQVIWLDESWNQTDIERIRLQAARKTSGLSVGISRRLLFDPSLHEFTIVDESELESLKNRNVSSITAKDVAFTNKGIQSLNRVVKLYLLHLDNCGITDDLLQSFTAHSSMTSLDIRNNPISDASVDWLINCKNLRTLRLANTQITDAGLSRILSSLDLDWIDISETATTERAWVSFTSKPSFRTRWIGLEKVAAMPKIIKQFEHVRAESLPTLALSAYGRLEPKSLAVFFGSRPNNTLNELEISPELLRVWPLEELFSGKSCLGILQIKATGDIASILKAASRECPSLHTLAIDNESVDSSVLAETPACVRTLMISHCKLTTDALTAIASRCPQLSRFYIGSSDLNGCSLEPISSMLRLHGLYITKTALTPEQRQTLTQLKPSLMECQTGN